MSSIAVKRILVGVMAAVINTAVIAKEASPPKMLQEPVLGLRYDATRVHFDQLSAEVNALCHAISSNENVIAHSWAYATARDAARTYYVFGGYFEDLHPEPGYPRYQKDELGVVVYIQGNECRAIDSARTVFDTRDFTEISQPVLRQLAGDLATRLAKAFGGKGQLRDAIRNQHVEQEQLPQELQQAFAPTSASNQLRRAGLFGCPELGRRVPDSPARSDFPFGCMIEAMMPTPIDDLQQVRARIAATAARMIAQDGADYGTAKAKAARQVLGVDRPSPNYLPDNIQVEDEVRRYQTLFHGPAQSARVKRLRCAALEVMDELAEFRPYLTGAVLNGTAGEHDDIHLQLFADSAKEVEIWLLNRNVQIEISETSHFKGGRYDPVETVSFLWHKEAVHAELYEMNDLRGALKPRSDGRLQRIDAAGLRALMATEDPLE